MFDEAFAPLDVAGLEVMGEDVEIGGTAVRAVRDEAEFFSQYGDGGFIGTRNCSFYVLESDAKLAKAGPGSRVVTKKDVWLVSTVRDMGGMLMLSCISTSGQSAPEF